MSVLEDIRFERSLPRENKEQILAKIGEFVSAWESNIDPTELNRRFSVKKVHGDTILPEVWKFKVSDGCRILFTKGKSLNIDIGGYEDALILLMFCNHDAQIVKARQLSKVMPKSAEELADQVADEKAAKLQYDPETSITRVFKHIGIEALIDLERLQGIYYLNKNQRECVNADYRPLILFGSAGSGKTTIGVYKLVDLIKQNPGIKVGYFTYSSKLAQSAKKIFHTVLENELEADEVTDYEVHVDFHPLRDWLKEETGIDYMIQYDQFNEQFFIPMRQNWSMNPEYKEVILNLTAYEAWREIRGLIKGYAGDDWHPHMDDNGVLSEKEYMRLSQQHSFYNKSQRKVLYALALKYVEWQKSQGVFDENDLCRRLLIRQQAINRQYCSYSYEKGYYKEWSTEEKISKNKKGKFSSYSYENDKDEKVSYQYEEEISNAADTKGSTVIGVGTLDIAMYDWIVIDEVQDLTELEIYLLQTRVRESGNFLLSGDYHQTIAPTYFDTKRIMTLLEHHNYRYKEDANRLVLTHNYRNPKQIVALANRLSAFRKQLFGKDKRNDYSEEVAMCELEGNLYTLCGSREEKKKLLREAVKKAYVYIVVASQREKEELEELLDNKIRIFTIYEVKGLENKYIIGVNLFSNFKNQWEKLCNAQKQHINTSLKDTNVSVLSENYFYRYMINMLYVTLTRAQESLCFIEDEVTADFITDLFDIEMQHECLFNEEIFGLDEDSSAEDFYLEAQKFEAAEDYRRALSQYEKLRLPKARLRENFCKGKLHEEVGKFKEAAVYYEQAKAWEEATKAYNKAKMYTKYYECFIKWDEKRFMEEIIYNETISYERDLKPHMTHFLSDKIKELCVNYYIEKLPVYNEEKEWANLCSEDLREQIEKATRALEVAGHG